MRSSYAALAVGVSSLLVVSAAGLAQGPPAGGGSAAPRRTLLGRPATNPAPAAKPSTPVATSAPKEDRQVFKSNQAIPEPTSLENLDAPKIALPTTPADPYLL